MKKRIFFLILTAICILTLSGCGDEAQKAPASEQLSASGPYWLIEASDTKDFSYAIPDGSGGTIDMTARLYFVAWKEGGEGMFGQYEGRALLRWIWI